ncbi:MAG: hypothetical protein ACRYFU_03700 [Janthinobacterium lividum]
MFYGPGVLTMLYANGYGTPRDYKLALRFACEQSWASDAEFALRVGHLEALSHTPAQSYTFDLCEDTTSGLSAARGLQRTAFMGVIMIGLRQEKTLRRSSIQRVTGLPTPGAVDSFRVELDSYTQGSHAIQS